MRPIPPPVRAASNAAEGGTANLERTSWPNRSIRRNAMWVLAGNTAFAASQWVILVLLVKLTTTQMVGQFIFAVAITSPLFLFANLQLNRVVATDVTGATPFSTYFRLRLVTTLLALFVAGVFAAVASLSHGSALVLLLVAFAKGLDSLSDLFHGLYQQHERMNYVAVSLLINGLLSAVSVALATWWMRDVVWASCAYLLGSAASLFGYNIRTGLVVLRPRSDSSPAIAARPLTIGALAPRGGWDREALMRLAWYAAPLGLVAGLATLTTNIPRYFIHHHLGEAGLGVYAAVAYVMVAGVTLIGAVCTAATPRLARSFAAGDARTFSMTLAKLVAMAVAAGGGGLIAALVAGRQILAILYRSDYAQQQGLFVWVMAAATMSYLSTVFGYAVTATRSFRLLILPHICVAAVTLGGCWLFVPRRGFLGAAWAVGLGEAAGCLAGLLIVTRNLGRMRLTNT